MLRPRPRCRLRTQTLPAARACCFTSRAAAPNPRVFLDISIGDGEPQRITFEARPLHIWQAVSRAVTLPFVCCAALHTDCAAGCRPVPLPHTHTPLHFTYSPAPVRVSVPASPNRVVLPPENFRALCTGARNVFSVDNPVPQVRSCCAQAKRAPTTRAENRCTSRARYSTGSSPSSCARAVTSRPTTAKASHCCIAPSAAKPGLRVMLRAAGGVSIGVQSDGSDFPAGKEFKDENFRIKHSEAGLLAMANRGRHTNTSNFYITLNECKWCSRIRTRSLRAVAPI